MIEQELVRRFQAAGRTIPVRQPQFDSVVGRGRKELRRFWAFAVAGVIGLTVGAISLTPAISELFTNEAQTSTPPASDDVYGGQVRPLIEEFAEGMRRGDVEGTWQMLSLRAKESLGGIDEWRKETRNVEYLFSWIARRPHDVFVSPLSGVSAVATVAEKDGALLTTVPVLVRPPTLRGGPETADLPSVDLVVDRQVGLTPENPAFSAGVACADSNCPVGDSTVIASDLDLSMLLEPAGKVQDVYFSLGGHEWVVEADLQEVADGVRATATYDGDVEPVDSVFVVSIVRPDGGIDSYGYRVTVEE